MANAMVGRTFVLRSLTRIALTCALVSTVAAGAAQPPPAEALWSHLEAARDEIPRDRFDLEAVVASVGTDPAALFTWVRDETTLLPYRGLLKGPTGVLLDRGGNALDRALLLRALLELAGWEASLVTATLPPDASAALAAAARAATPAPAPIGREHATDLAARAAQELELDESDVAAALARAAAETRSFDALLATRSARLGDALLAALAPHPDASTTSDPFSEGWWVRVVLEDGSTQDLDPSLPDALPGERLAADGRVFDPDTLEAFATLDGPCPDLTCGDRLHVVVVRAIAETLRDDGLVEHVLLERAVLPAAVLGTPLALSVTAYGGDGAPDPFGTTGAAAALRDALLDHDAWRPELTIGEASVPGRVVRVDGTVHDEPGEPPAASSGGVGGIGLGGFGFGFGGGADEDEEEEGADGFTALWWEYAVHTPGVGRTVERREVFDLLGPAARASGAWDAFDASSEARFERALALAGQSELALLPAALHPDLLHFLAATRLLAERDAWDAFAARGTSAAMVDVNARLNALAGLRTAPERFALARARASRDDGRGAQTGLLALAHHRRLASDLSTVQGFDLIAAPPAPFATAVREGVADAVLESLSSAAGEADGGARNDGPTVAEAFDRDPSSWRVLRHHEADHPDGVAALAALPPDLAARVRADLDAGFTVVVPSDAADAVGWWRVDPVSGATLGRGTRGWGQATTSYAERINVVMQLRGVVNQYAAMGQCLGLAVTQPLQGIEGVGDELQACIFSLVCGQVNTAAGILVKDEAWTSVILLGTIDALWGGVSEAGFGGFCGSIWKRLAP